MILPQHLSSEMNTYVQQWVIYLLNIISQIKRKINQSLLRFVTKISDRNYNFKFRSNVRIIYIFLLTLFRKSRIPIK